MLAVIAGAAGYWAYSTNAAKQQAAPVAGIRTAKAVAGPLIQTTRIAGTSSARKFANVTAPTMRGREGSGQMNILFIAKSGTLVKKGDKLLEIDAQSMQDHVDDLADTIRQAASDVQRRQAEQMVEWEALQQTLRVSKANLEKANWDYKAQEVRSDVERELLKLSVDEASARYKQQLNDVASRKASQEAEIKILKITEERHTRHRNRHVIDVSRFKIFAPMDGLVVMQTTFRGGEFTQVQQGDNLNPGQSVMRVVDLRSMQVEASINQSQTSLLRIGQPVTVGLDAFPGVQLKGKLYSIGALAVGGWRQQYFIRNVPVSISIEEYNPKVIPDLSAFGDVEIGRDKDGVQIPQSAVVTEEGKSFVMLKTGNGFEKRAVTLGEHNATSVLVESGLSAGDEVRLMS
ncbi:MAG: HlyD family efflux transporter periplasmic adaptor subunit [Bryobacteraceae bacterium]